MMFNVSRETMEIKDLSINVIEPNSGQIDGLPSNPRKISRKRLDALKRSIQDAPEMLGLRELIVYPHNGKFVVIGGNMRYKACKSLGFKFLPCKVLPVETPVAKLQEYTIKDNIGFGDDDKNKLQSEWDLQTLQEWGVDIDHWSEKAEARCELTPRPSTITKPDIIVYCNFKKSKSGELLKKIKENPENAEYFAENLAETLQKIFCNFDGWALVTAPKRRHKENNFAERVCTIAAAKIGINFYKDVFECRTKQRIEPDFTVTKEIKENNIILYDDIITTGSTLKAMHNCLIGKNVLCFAGINNN